jgi:acetolactate synthase regulatory subunit
MKQTLSCIVQNRLGALDRVLGAFTTRGIVPEKLQTEIADEGQTLQILISFKCDGGDKAFQTLVKYLYKQVTVLQVQWLVDPQMSMPAEKQVHTLGMYPVNGGQARPEHQLLAAWLPWMDEPRHFSRVAAAIGERA